MDFVFASESVADGSASPLPDQGAAILARRGFRETELEFLMRRAMEESRLARSARTPEAAAAHAYLSAAYSTEIARETARTAELEALALRIS